MDDVTYYSPDYNVGYILLGPHIAFSVIASIFVGLRTYTARKVLKAPWAVDEYVSIVALVANHIMLVCEGAGVACGLGASMDKILTEYKGGIVAFLKCILAIECAYGTACPLSKIAVLAMYYRIFSTSNLLRYCVWVITAMLGGWGISVVLVSIFSCNPIAGFWNPSIPSTCIDSSKFYIGITVPNIIFDVLTVALPVHEVWKLQMGRKKKLAITSVFLLGGSVVLASITRLVLFCIYRPGGGSSGNNISQTVVFPHTASAIEICLAIIGACLPPCAPLLRRFIHGATTVASKDTGSKKTSAKSQKLGTLITIGRISNRGGPNSKMSKDDVDLDGSFERLDDGASLQGSTDDLYNEQNKTRGNNRPSRGAEIHVQREVQIESSDSYTELDHHNRVVNIPMRNL